MKETTTQTAKQDLKDAISKWKGVSSLIGDLDGKYFSYKWAVLKLDTSDKRSNHDYKHYTDFEPFSMEDDGADGDNAIYASYRPHSRY